MVCCWSCHSSSWSEGSSRCYERGLGLWGRVGRWDRIGGIGLGILELGLIRFMLILLFLLLILL